MKSKIQIHSITYDTIEINGSTRRVNFISHEEIVAHMNFYHELSNTNTFTISGLHGKIVPDND